MKIIVVASLILLSVLAYLLSAVLKARALPPAPAPARATSFVFVKIPESILPVARGEKYEDPLDAALRRAGLGEVTGGGSQLGEPNPDGSAHVEWVGIDVELNELETGLALLKSELLRLGAPDTTRLEYRAGGEDRSETIR